MARSKLGAHQPFFQARRPCPIDPTIAMPRVIQPGGRSGKMRVRYTARRKLGLIASVRHLGADDFDDNASGMSRKCHIVESEMRELRTQ